MSRHGSREASMVRMLLMLTVTCLACVVSGCVSHVGHVVTDVRTGEDGQLRFVKCELVVGSGFFGAYGEYENCHAEPAPASNASTVSSTAIIR
jgi:hypothetical protein